MRCNLHLLAALAAAAFVTSALAGGSNYGITPGALANFSGKVSEWPVPTPRFARDPAPGPDGNIYVGDSNNHKVRKLSGK